MSRVGSAGSGGIIVPAHGPRPTDVLLVGEAPGREESRRLRPFVGKSGAEQEAYLARHGVSPARWRMTNVIPLYREGNPDPTPRDITEWAHVLEAEVCKTQPKLIVAVGRFAMRFFLGEEADLDTCYGMAHRGGAFDASIAHRANGAVVVPIIHPAAGFYDGDARAPIAAGYARVAATLKKIQANKPIDLREDEYAGREQYEDCTGRQFAKRVREADGVIGIDTEGDESWPWMSIQASVADGTGYMLRTVQADFAAGVTALQKLADNETLVVLHNGMHDIGISRSMGLNLSRARLFDSMYASYLLRLEPQGLKALAWRWCGVRMTSYQETVGDAAREKQLEWLFRARAMEWPKPEARVNVGNDGQPKLYTPQSIGRRIDNIIIDVYAKDADPYERWKDMDEELAAKVEAALGKMPVATLADIPLERAVAYGCKDSDVTLRLYWRLSAELRRLGKTKLMQQGMEVLPALEEMQATGLPASRVAFEQLRDRMSAEMDKMQARISRLYFNGKPFNPKSPPQVATLLRRRGLEPAKTTKTGAMSTGKGSIEHLRYKDEAVEAVIGWRERQHTRDMFCVSTLALMDPERDIQTVRPRLKWTRTHTRRLATADPNLMAFPKHEKPGGMDYGSMVRGCFVCPPGEVLLEADLSQIESRLLAHESNDGLLVKLFNDNRDIHTETAAHLFGVSLDDVTKVQRFFAKRINFGIPYGVSGMGLATQLRVMGIEGWDDDACSHFIKEWGKLYKGATRYFAETERAVVATGWVEDFWGMRRYLPAVWSDDRKMASEARRQAVNHRIQSGAQGMVQRALAWLYPRVKSWQAEGKTVKLCLTIHDSILLQVSEPLYEEVAAVTIEALTQHNGLPMRVPTLAEAKMARSWGKL